MLKIENGKQVITCDKCGQVDSAPEANAGDKFFELGWAFWPKAVKYVHVCAHCQTQKERRQHDFVKTIIEKKP